MPKDPRQYARIAVDLPASRKLADAPPQTKWLYVVSVLWSTQNLTDGHITPAVVCGLAGVPPRYGRDLIGRDLWHEKGHACLRCPQPGHHSEVVIHDFLSHQDDAETIHRNRDAKANSARMANHIRWNHPGPFERCPKCND